MISTKFRSILPLLLFLPGLAFAQNSQQEQNQPYSGETEIAITVEEAIQIALVNNHMLRAGQLDIELANAQIREAWGSVYPQIGSSGEYTRNLRTPNPFAGSDAGGLFDTFGAIEWLAFNEGARTDSDPSTDPIPFDEFLRRQSEGYQDAGLSPPGMDGTNPFAVENQFNFGVNVTQTIYNGAAFAAIRGARQLREMNEDGYERQRQEVADNIRSTFYGALLASEQVDVLRASVERLRETVRETSRSVEAGVASKFDRVSAEVELVNLETELIESENNADLAVKNLALQLGISPRTDLTLRGSFELEDLDRFEIQDAETAHEIALQQRPDLKQTQGQLELQEVERRITRSQYFPTVSAFANAAYIGSVPSNRTEISTVEGEDFAFTSTDRGFFDDSYWEPAVAVGIRMNWSIFDGFQRRAQVQQNSIGIRQTEINMEFQKNAIYLEIEEAIDNIDTAMRRIRSQERNLEQAELNYEFSVTRLREGAGTALEERQASSLLDQSKLSYLAAVHDYLVAQSRYRKALGQPILK
ncbi:TolC family protein [Rhodohalobacter sp. SW132]|uniref:TolC family protein n=1 Tax=Rhodohalobacter sp. SW132 TaxID=2293433 RepID=UPI0013159E23|nr:TolC family protein [Rhodohalobacter sp. SW132]